METPLPVPTPFDITELSGATYPFVYIAGWVIVALILFALGNFLFHRVRKTKNNVVAIKLSEKLISRSYEISSDPEATVESLKSALAMTLQSSVKDAIDPPLYKKIVFCLYQRSPDKEVLRETLIELLAARSL